jgi:hypothetical protein
MRRRGRNEASCPQMKTPAELSPMAGAPVCAPIGESRGIQSERSAEVNWRADRVDAPPAPATKQHRSIVCSTARVYGGSD